MTRIDVRPESSTTTEMSPAPASMLFSIIAKLFNLAHPTFAVFGQKDYQQAQVIQRMVRDLNFDLEVVVAPIVREPSGLARSSRNTYLSAEEKERALAISRALREIDGTTFTDAKGRRATTAAIAKKLTAAGLVVDYVACVDAATLAPRKAIGQGTCVLVAAYDGKTRLIDNRAF